MTQRTALYDQHVVNKGQMVTFAGWELPLHYGSQLEEHRAVRQGAGLFDVSHMGIIDIRGQEAETFLRYLLANDVRKLLVGRSLYTCLLNESGGILDDLIVYALVDRYRLVVNAATAAEDLTWIQAQSAQWDVVVEPVADKCILAVQGPESERILSQVLGTDRLHTMPSFACVLWDEVMCGRTGYTGEDGFECLVSTDRAVTLWEDFLSVGAVPCGLGARDSLRLEAGLHLYGSDMTAETSPLVSRLGWTVSFEDPDRAFVGRSALEAQKVAGLTEQLVGVRLRGKGVLRAGQVVCIAGEEVGRVTSGGYSPVLDCGIGFVRMSIQDLLGAYVQRGAKQLQLKQVTLPFVRRGKVVCQEVGV